MKHYLYLNIQTGNKFKTTLEGKRQLESNPKLVAISKYLGECDEKGLQAEVLAQTTEKVMDDLKKVEEKQNGKKIKFTEPTE